MENYPIYASKNAEKKRADLLFIGEEDKKHYVLIKDYSTFMYDQTLHRGSKYQYRRNIKTSY